MNENLKIDKSIDKLYFPELDGLRFLAFLLVFVHHSSLFSKLRTNGWIGVDLFFVLSSFLFTKLLIAEYYKTNTISFKKFYLRRIFRIWPIYFLFIGFSFTLYLLSKGQITNNIGIRIFGLFAFSDNIMTAIYGWNPMPFIAHLWTIAYEEQFYVFVPIIIFLLIRSSFKTKVIFITSIYILFSGIRLALIANNVTSTVLYVLPITHFESIIMGMVIGFGGYDFLLEKIKPLIIGLIGILFFALLYLPYLVDTSDGNITSYWDLLHYSLIGISTSLVIFSVSNSKLLKKIFSKSLFVFLGKRSYGLYVYHSLGIAVGSYLIAHSSILPSNSLVSFIYSFSFTVIVSIISYKFIETPFLKLKKKFEVIKSRPI